MAKAKDRLKHGAEAAAGAGVLAGTASLQRIEGKVQGMQQARVDRKIHNVKTRLNDAGTPMGNRTNVNGQYMGRGSAEKQARKARFKAMQGELNDLNAKRKSIKRPRLAGNTKATWTGIATGAPMLWHGTRSQFQKDFKRRDADAAIVGGGLGAGAWQESSYKLKGFDRRAERKIAEDPHLRQKARAYQNANRPKNAKAGDPAWRPYFRNYPKDLPGGRLKRTLAVTHTGKTGAAFTVGAGVAGAAGAAKTSQNLRAKKQVRKNMDTGTSAFGVEHVSKALPGQQQPSKGRLNTGTVFGPYHGLVAGKGAGGKAKSAGTQWGLSTAGALGGSTLGSVAGGLATRGRSAGAIRAAGTIGGVTGGLAGNRKGTKIASNRGWLKPESR